MTSAGRIGVSFRLYMREPGRRPLVIALIVLLPFFFITRAIAATETTPRTLSPSFLASPALQWLGPRFNQTNDSWSAGSR